MQRTAGVGPSSRGDEEAAKGVADIRGGYNSMVNNKNLSYVFAGTRWKIKHHLTKQQAAASRALLKKSESRIFIRGMSRIFNIAVKKMQKSIMWYGVNRRGKKNDFATRHFAAYRNHSTAFIKGARARYKFNVYREILGIIELAWMKLASLKKIISTKWSEHGRM